MRLRATADIAPTATSVLATVEPVVTIVLAAAFLDERLGSGLALIRSSAADTTSTSAGLIAGGASLVVATGLIAVRNRRKASDF